MSTIKIKQEGSLEYALDRGYVAKVDTKKCINCGTCRENCPVEAIDEAQRWICRVCPECTDQPVMRLADIDAFCTKQSCTTACPLGISPQGYIGLARNGKDLRVRHPRSPPLLKLHSVYHGGLRFSSKIAWKNGGTGPSFVIE